MKQPITGFHKDDENHWVAQLACGHFQHVRHDPPMTERKWTQTQEGRDSMIGFELDCLKCEDCDLATSVTDWLIDHPELLPLFKELNIDYCCGGKSLETACRERDLDPGKILTEIRQLI